MNKLVQEQLNLLSNNLSFIVDDKNSSMIPSSFDHIIFKHSSSSLKDFEDRVIIFEDYIIKPFEGFDFHNKFNNGTPPPFKYMKGKVVKETEKMYYLDVKANVFKSNFCNHCLKKGTFDYLCDNCSKLYKDVCNVTWKGWCPKKSCTIK